jgi:hypothetical protein
VQELRDDLVPCILSARQSRRVKPFIKKRASCCNPALKLNQSDRCHSYLNTAATVESVLARKHSNVFVYAKLIENENHHDCARHVYSTV